MVPQSRSLANLLLDLDGAGDGLDPALAAATRADDAGTGPGRGVELAVRMGRLPDLQASLLPGIDGAAAGMPAGAQALVDEPGQMPWTSPPGGPALAAAVGMMPADHAAAPRTAGPPSRSDVFNVLRASVGKDAMAGNDVMATAAEAPGRDDPASGAMLPPAGSRDGSETVGERAMQAAAGGGIGFPVPLDGGREGIPAAAGADGATRQPRLHAMLSAGLARRVARDRLTDAWQQAEGDGAESPYRPVPHGGGAGLDRMQAVAVAGRLDATGDAASDLEPAGSSGTMAGAFQMSLMRSQAWSDDGRPLQALRQVAVPAGQPSGGRVTPAWGRSVDYRSDRPTSGRALADTAGRDMPDAGQSPTVQLNGDFVVDGRQLGKVAAASQAGEAALPARSTSRVNLRTIPTYTGMQIPR